MPVNCDNDGAEALLESAPPPLNHGERTVRRGVAPPPRPYPQTQFLFTSLSLPYSAFFLSQKYFPPV